MKPVFLVTPSIDDDDVTESRNTKYALRALSDSLSRNEAPFHGELLYDRMRDRNCADKNQLAATSWLRLCNKLIVYEDVGITPRMQSVIDLAESLKIPIEKRRFLSKLSLYVYYNGGTLESMATEENRWLVVYMVDEEITIKRCDTSHDAAEFSWFIEDPNVAVFGPMRSY